MESLFSKRLTILFDETKRSTGMGQEDMLVAIEADTGHKISQSSYSAYMKDKKVPSYLTVQAFCKFHGVSFEWITGQVDERTPTDELIQKVKDIGESATGDLSDQLFSLPENERTAITATIAAAVEDQKRRNEYEERWKRLERLVRLMDTDGRIKAFIDSEYGRFLGVGSKDPVGEFAN